MSSRAQALSWHLKRYDRDLFACDAPRSEANRESTPAIWVLRRNREKAHEPHFIFALTDDWTAKGIPREWGIDVVLNRLKAIDLWRSSETVVDRLLADYARDEESEARAARNSIESFLIEFRRPFAKATNNINTSLLPKVDARRKGDLKYVRTK